MAKKTKNKIVYGKVSLSDEDLDWEKAKVRITTMIDYPVLKALKELAKEDDIGYQTLINKILAAYANDKDFRQMMEGKEWVKSNMESVVSSLAKRVDQLEKKIG